MFIHNTWHLTQHMLLDHSTGPCLGSDALLQPFAFPLLHNLPNVCYFLEATVCIFLLTSNAAGQALKPLQMVTHIWYPYENQQIHAQPCARVPHQYCICLAPSSHPSPKQRSFVGEQRAGSFCSCLITLLFQPLPHLCSTTRLHVCTLTNTRIHTQSHAFTHTQPHTYTFELTVLLSGQWKRAG